MAELNQQQNQTPTPKKPRLTVWHIIAIALVGIFLVLTLSNLKAILSPVRQLTSILAPITVGLVLAYILNFFLRFFEYKLFRNVKKRTVNRALSMVCSYILLLSIIAGILFLIIPAVIESFAELQIKGTTFITNLINSLNQYISLIPGVDTEQLAMFFDLEKVLTYVFNLLSTSGNWIITNIASIAGGTLTVLKNIIVGLFISIYVLLSKERLNAGCRRVFRALLSKKNETRLIGYFARAHSKFGGYMIGKLADSTIVMLVCLVLFNIFKIPYPVLIAAIIGVTDIIPFFGPFLGAIPSALIIFIIDPWKAVLFVLLILAVQQLDGNFIAPLILGDRTGLSSLGVIVAVTVMGGIFNVVGMLIGVPLFALIMTILDDFITSRLKEKGEPTSLRKYYPADAFIRPQDEDSAQITLTQRFARWVASVEQEEVDADRPLGIRATVSRGARKTFLAIGHFFRRLFSIKPIPEDHQGGIYQSICLHGIPTKRFALRAIFLTIPTLFLYPFYVIEVVSQGINVACRKDGKRTWGLFPFLTFSVLTLGIFPLIWHCKVINRMQNYCDARGMKCLISKRYYLCWSLIGLPILIGPVIALFRFLAAFRAIAFRFNNAHTFPLSAEALAVGVPDPTEEQRPRKSIIEQILAPVEELAEEEQKDEESDSDDEGEAPVLNQ